jgi:hypothetical protein
MGPEAGMGQERKIPPAGPIEAGDAADDNGAVALER